MIECRGVSFSYGRRARPVFEGFDWATTAGVTFVLGPNGAGKSTLMKLLIGALEPQCGQIVLDGHVCPARGKDRREWRRRIGWVPQQAEQVSGLTVLEQVAYCGWLKGLGRAEAVRRAGEAIERVDLSSKASERATALSGGQARRMAIASALVHDSSVVLLDEPTAGLDPVQRDRLHAVIARQTEIDWVISTHQTEDLAVRATSIQVLDRGELVFGGSPAEFLQRGADGEGDSSALRAYRSIIGEVE